MRPRKIRERCLFVREEWPFQDERILINHHIAKKSALRGSQSAVPATKSALRGSQSAVPATKSAHRGSQSAVPATKSANEPHVQKSKSHDSLRMSRNLSSSTITALSKVLHLPRNLHLEVKPLRSLAPVTKSRLWTTKTRGYQLHEQDMKLSTSLRSQTRIWRVQCPAGPWHFVPP